MLSLSVKSNAKSQNAWDIKAKVLFAILVFCMIDSSWLFSHFHQITCRGSRSRQRWCSTVGASRSVMRRRTSLNPLSGENLTLSGAKPHLIRWKTSPLIISPYVQISYHLSTPHLTSPHITSHHGQWWGERQVWAPYQVRNLILSGEKPHLIRCKISSLMLSSYVQTSYHLGTPHFIWWTHQEETSHNLTLTHL